MSSILTNMSAMTAVANLAATQKSLADTQNQISTGLKVSSAKDNAAYYSIATSMRTNVGNLSAVSDSLNLGSSVVATATSALSNMTTVLQSISKALVSASQPGTDLNAVNTQISALRSQLANTVATSSFNGVNLLDGSNSSTNNGQVFFVAGVGGSGANTKVNTLTVDTSTTNFQGANYTSGNALVTTAATADKALVNAQSANTSAISSLQNAVANLSTSDFADAASTATSSAFKAVFGTGASIASGVVTGIDGASIAGKLIGTGTGASVTIDSASRTATAYNNATSGTGTGTLTTLYGAGASQATTTSTVTGSAVQTAALADAAAKTNPASNTIYSGALFKVSQISLSSGSADGTTPATSADTIANYLKQVGAAISAVTNASETLGAAASNIDLQSTYTSSLSSSLTSGVGSLVDADMNEVSTRLSALQTQQQLGVQALSVANQNSQLILKLFQ